MANFTKLSAEEVQTILRDFGVGEYVSHEALPQGTINSNYRVITADGPWFLRVNEGKSEREVVAEADLCRFLQSSVRVAAPLRTKDDQPFVCVPGKPKFCSLFPWVAGEHLSVAARRPAHLFAVGVELALLHLANYPGHLGRGIYTLADLKQRVQSIAAAIEAPEILAASVRLDEELAFVSAHIQRNVPEGVIHQDLFPDNVLFGADGRITALLDFEQAIRGRFVYDLAVSLLAWAYTSQFDADHLRAMVGGYESRRPLSGPERESLWIEARLAAARFAITRITDVTLKGGDTTTKDYRRYLARLGDLETLGADGFTGLCFG